MEWGAGGVDEIVTQTNHRTVSLHVAAVWADAVFDPCPKLEQQSLWSKWLPGWALLKPVAQVVEVLTMYLADNKWAIDTWYVYHY